MTRPPLFSFAGIRAAFGFHAHEPQNPARELALIGHRKRHADVRAVAKQIREELGLPPSPGLKP